MNKYYLGKSREEVPSFFSTGNVYEGESYKRASLQLWGKEFLEKYAALSKWEDFYQKSISYFIVDANVTIEKQLPLGISNEFKKLKTVEQVKKFASKYGILGITKLDPSEVMALTAENRHIELNFNVIEPIEFWFDCAIKIRCITSLYEALQVAFKEQLELDLELEEIKGNAGETMAYLYKWVYVEGKQAVTLQSIFEADVIEQFDSDDLISQHLKIGRDILIQSIKPFINGYIHLSEEIIPNENSPVGIEIIEHKYTNSLITAIFYDLWLLLVANVPAGRCPKCNKPFIQIERGRKRKFCSESCRVLWNRKKARQ